MSAKWAWYNPAETVETSSLSFAPTNGVASAAQELHLANDLDGTGPATASEDILVTALSRNAGVGDYTMDDEIAANGWLEVRLIGTTGSDIPTQTSGWTRLGRGRFMRVVGIPRESTRHFEIRLNIPIGAGVVAKDVKLRVIEGLRAISLEMGHYEGGAQGLVMGLGDQSRSQILSGFILTPEGTPDNTANYTRGVYTHEGIPYPEIAGKLTFNDEDVNTDALASGEEYLAQLSVGATGITVTKSAKGTAPLPESDLPAVPDGEESIGYVVVPFDATISAGDIHQDDEHPLVYGGAALIGTGLAPEVHPFEMMVGNNLLVSPSIFEVILTDDDLNYVWANTDGSVTAEVDGIQPTDCSMLLYEATVAAGVITALRDCRHWLYPNPVEVTLSRAGALNTGDVASGVLPTRAQCYLLPIGGIVASLDEPGTTNESTWEIEASDRGAAFATLFPSAEADQYPSIAFDAAEPTTFDAFPEEFSFHGGTRFRSTLTAEAGAGDSEGQTITLRFSAVGAA